MQSEILFYLGTLSLMLEILTLIRAYSPHNRLFFFFYYEKKKGLVGAFIVPTHLNPNLTWRGAHLGNNGAYHYPNPQLPDLQV